MYSTFKLMTGHYVWFFTDGCDQPEYCVLLFGKGNVCACVCVCLHFVYVETLMLSSFAFVRLAVCWPRTSPSYKTPRCQFGTQMGLWESQIWTVLFTGLAIQHLSPRHQCFYCHKRRTTLCIRSKYSSSKERTCQSTIAIAFYSTLNILSCKLNRMCFNKKRSSVW